MLGCDVNRSTRHFQPHIEKRLVALRTAYVRIIDGDGRQETESGLQRRHRDVVTSDLDHWRVVEPFV
jgi:hypothetical protein